MTSDEINLDHGVGREREEKDETPCKLEEILKKSGPKDSGLQESKEDYVGVAEEASERIEGDFLRRREIEKARVEKPKELWTQEGKGDSVAALRPREEIVKFLRDRSISESLIVTLLKVGFTDEFSRLLRAMGFSDEDTAELGKLWSLETNREEINSSVSLPSSSNEYLSPDGIYLKHHLSRALSSALRDIVARKPYNPIEYLGHWLLNYKICEERGKRLKELKLELMIEREKHRLKEKVQTEEVISVTSGHEEEEQYVDDSNFSDYE
ncbi:hypothetical protein WN55_03651 [Dufourea novaeangliae]|uniref:DPY30 domain-containing protein 2 n=1 Tax=Dufourea novaeangliae TaxID=178035 RepID=A0A154PJ29_DUFNO|nr:hypothetical protein WN55_03651 [Dufourea novaeangliae]